MVNMKVTNKDTKVKDINSLPEKLMLYIFSYLNHHDKNNCALVSRQWRNLAQNPKLWKALKLRPEFKDAIHVKNMEYFTYLLGHRFNQTLEYIELPVEFITSNIIHELANKCTNLKYITMDFAAAMQLQDFNDLNNFPCNLKSMTICLSEVIFLEGFMRRIYSFLSSLEILSLIGTLENSNDPDETYETINISKIKAYTPNLRVINLYGITFIEDNHIESVAGSCIHLECVSLYYSSRFKGYSLKTLMGRCKKIKSLLLPNTGLENEAIKQVEWDQTNLEELDLSSTDLDEATLLYLLSNAPNLTYLNVAYCDGFTDKVFETLIKNKKFSNLKVLNLSHTVNLNFELVFEFLKNYGEQLVGFSYCGNTKVTEHFWLNSIKFLTNLKICAMGANLGWFRKIACRIHVDQIMNSFAIYCPYLERLEFQWDPETIRYGDNCRKFIDHTRLKCTRLRSLVLSDGEFYELVKSNFERAGRHKTVRTTTSYKTTLNSLLRFNPQLLFN